MRKLTTLLALSLMPLLGLQAQQTFEERNGKLEIEAENLDLTGSWKIQTSVNGYSGSGYINWTGADFFRTPDKGIITTKIKINTPGKYKFKWISKVGKGTVPTEHNDSWLKFKDASKFYAEKPGSILYPSGSGKTPNPEGAGGRGYFKVYINSTTNWTDRSWTSDKDPHAIIVEFNEAGTYTMEIGARSNAHLIDKVMLNLEKAFTNDNNNNFIEGRVAVVADGNYRDSDDIAGTPVSLAILKAFGKNDKLVHYSHSCDLRPGANDPGGKFREEEMKISCEGTASRWGGFDGIKFYNCQTEKDATINHLRDQINASSANDPLWIIEAGEPDIMWEAVNKAQNNKRRFVYIVTHHPANDRGDFHDLSDVMALGIPNGNLKRIPDQNILLKKPLRTWHWARDHQDSRVRWLWERGFRAQEEDMNYNGIRGDMDPSDAGMLYYWCTREQGGDENCDIPKLIELFNGYINNNSGNNPPTGSFSQPTVTSLEENYTELYVLVEASDPDGDDISLTLSLDGREIRTERGAPYEWGHESNNADTKIELLGLTPGNHEIKVVITDNKGASKTITKTISVNEKKGPYTGSAITIPGILEAESYDKGGQGISYSDTDSENKGADESNFRVNDGVDIGAGNDGNVVGWTSKDEWMDYSVNVSEGGDFEMELFASSLRGGGILEIESNGNIISTIDISSTDSWDTYSTFKETITLIEGEQVLKLRIKEAGFNIDKIQFKSVITSTEGNTTTQGLFIFPNPTTGVFNLSREVDWKIITNQGILIKEGKGSQVNISSEPSGIYILETGSSKIKVNKK